MREPFDSSASAEELFLEYAKTRDIATRNELVKRYLYIADAIARRHAGRSIDYEDLFQVASLALIQAVDRFDMGKGVKFTTFATPTVLGVIKNHFRDNARNVRMPRRASELLRRIEKAREELYATLLRSPTPDEIAAHLDVPLDNVLEALETGESLSVASLNAKVGEDGEGQLMDMIGGEDPGFAMVDIQEFITKEMEKLTEAERFVVTQRYWKGRSQRDIAKEMHVSQMYVSRVERRIIDRFRKSIVS